MCDLARTGDLIAHLLQILEVRSDGGDGAVFRVVGTVRRHGGWMASKGRILERRRAPSRPPRFLAVELWPTGQGTRRKTPSGLPASIAAAGGQDCTRQGKSGW
jgi:hypothetical protein